MWKSAGRAPSLGVLLWYLPYNWGKITENLSQGKKNLSQVKKNLRVQYIYYQNTHTLQKPHTHTHTHTQHILQNNIKPPQYKLKQTQYKLYPNEIVTI